MIVRSRDRHRDGMGIAADSSSRDGTGIPAKSRKFGIGFFNLWVIFCVFNHFDSGFKNRFGFSNHFDFGFENGFGFLNHFDFGLKNLKLKK